LQIKTTTTTNNLAAVSDEEDDDDDDETTPNVSSSFDGCRIVMHRCLIGRPVPIVVVVTNASMRNASLDKAANGGNLGSTEA
jgi:hypothetical protein